MDPQVEETCRTDRICSSMLENGGSEGGSGGRAQNERQMATSTGNNQLVSTNPFNNFQNSQYVDIKNGIFSGWLIE